MNKHRIQWVVSLVLLAAFLFIASGVGAAPQDGSVVQISAAKNAFRAAEDVLVSVTLSNPYKNTLRILKWFTPMDGVEEPVFRVTVNGKPVSYTGAVYKRPHPTSSDYISLKSGESVTYAVDLGAYYDLSSSGQYQIYYVATGHNLFDEKGGTPDSLVSASISIKVEGRPAKRPTTTTTPTTNPPPGGNTFKACTTTQQGILVNARNQAKTYSSNAVNYLQPLTDGTQRYMEWFGVFTAQRYGTVKSNFGKISDAFFNKGITFDCSCKQNYYAYVYPNSPYVIYLCSVFWSAPLGGTDSQAGTLIHEMSHFNVVAGTDDYVYGQSGARNLAITDPSKAIDNADNHEYFAENTPALP